MATQRKIPKNIFGIISFNINDLSTPATCEYIDIGKDDSHSEVVQEADIERNRSLLNSSRYVPVNYWIVFDGNAYTVQSFPIDSQPTDIENGYVGPFESEYEANSFIEEMRDTLTNNDIYINTKQWNSSSQSSRRTSTALNLLILPQS